MFLAEGQAVTEQFEAGDVGYAPRGAGHYIKNTGQDVCRVLIGFNAGRYQSIELTAWLAGNPKDLIAADFGIGPDLAQKFPDRMAFIEGPSKAR